MKCRNKWSVFLLEGGDQGSPTGILSVAVETKSVEGVEVVRVNKNKSDSQEHRSHDAE